MDVREKVEQQEEANCEQRKKGKCQEGNENAILREHRD